MNVKTEKKRVIALALRKDTAGPFNLNALFYPPVKKALVQDLFRNKWIASNIPRGLATGLASEYNEKNMPCIETPCGLAVGSLQFSLSRTLSQLSFERAAKSRLQKRRNTSDA